MFWCKKPKVIAQAGSQAPGFDLEDLAGGTRSLGQILESGPVMIAFFKASCPVCQLTFPFLERLSSGSGLQIIGISQDDAETTKAFNERFGVTFPTLLDSESKGYPSSNAYGISAVPSLFVVEVDGRISRSFAGFSKGELEDLGKRVGRPAFGPQDSVPEWKAG